MIALFPSKLFKQTRAVLAICLFQVCLLGTHWLGFHHSISHAGLQQQSVAIEVNGTLNHGSDLCHLFDALTLASFVPQTSLSHKHIQFDSHSIISSLKTQVAQTATSAYLSRAPPSLSL